MSQEIANRLRCHCPKCIDFHTHFLLTEVLDESEPHSASSCFGKHPFPRNHPSFERMFRPDMHIEDMDKHGIDINVLSSGDAMQGRSWATPDQQSRLSALVNDECERWVSSYPDRFIGTAVLPWGDVKLALAELERARTAGINIVLMPSNYRGDYLGDERFFDLWAAFENYQMPVFIHPEGVTDRWFQKYSFWNSIGQSIEEVRVMSSIIYEGVLDRFPKSRIVMAHGGGYMPHYMGRLDRNAYYRPDTVKNLSKKPSEYLSDFYYDSCTYEARTLEILVERVGIDRIVMGGDYPASLLDPIDLLAETNLSVEDQAKIAGGNAAEMLGLGPQG